MDWKQYQNETAEFFRSLGCDAEVEAKVVGIRAEHKIDVWVRFKKFGLETRWVIECKYWNSAVPKEKVLALRTIVEDVGADRGILISTAGFQSGAVRSSEKTNITLTNLDGLKETAQEDFVTSVLHRLEIRAAELKHALHDLYTTEQTRPNLWTSKFRPGVDGSSIIRTIGQLAVLGHGFDRARLKKPPYPVKFDDTGQQKLVVDALDEFIAQASEVISDAESTLNVQNVQQSK